MKTAHWLVRVSKTTAGIVCAVLACFGFLSAMSVHDLFLTLFSSIVLIGGVITTIEGVSGKSIEDL